MTESVLINILTAFEGEWEGLFGIDNHNPEDDWVPQGGSSPLSLTNYTIAEFGNFVESWRADSESTLFSDPFLDYEQSDKDWWYNQLTAEELAEGFRQYQEDIGFISNPYWAFRYAVDLAGGFYDSLDSYTQPDVISMPLHTTS